MKNKRNLFIAFEGIDGSGKSTQVKLLSEKMNAAGLNIHLTSEPTTSAIGSIIRNIMTTNIEADHRTIAALFVADRLDHILNKKNGMLRMLEDGHTVISDRYYFSSYAYQGVHVPVEWVISANSLSAGLLKPDLNIFIDVLPDQCMQRLNLGRKSIELYETEENLHRVREKYFEAFERLGSHENIFITNGNRPQEDVAADIWQEITTIMSVVKT